jgi:UPF0271 protein
VPRTLRPAGDRAFLVECASRADAHALTRALLHQPLTGQEDVIPDEATVLVVFDGPRPAAAVRSRLREPAAAGETVPATPVRARSLCVHGDTPGAVAIAAAVRARLTASGIRLAPFAPLPGTR